jgi:hypothetical protein
MDRKSGYYVVLGLVIGAVLGVGLGAALGSCAEALYPPEEGEQDSSP